MKTLCLAFLTAYRFGISPWLGPACRFEPTCSTYAFEAIQQFGVLRGVGLALWRLLKCHPLHSGGYDPVTSGCGMRRGK